MEEAVEKSKKRKRNEKEAIDKIKKGKAAKKSKGKRGKKRDPDDDEDDDEEYEDGLDSMYAKSRPAPGQFEHCEICSKRFTVTPYSKEGPEGGLVCTPCGKELAKDMKAEKKAAAPKPAGRKRRKLESDRLDGFAVGGSKSLQQLCIEKVAKHHDDIDELGDMPQPVLERLSEIFSKRRVLNPKTLPLFLRPDVDTVAIHDAAYLEVDDYKQIFAVIPKLQKLVLGNACQFKDEALDYMLERCKNLKHLQLYAANLITNAMWKRLFEEAGSQLEVVMLKWLDAAFEDQAVQQMVQHCHKLKRLKLKLCRRIGEDAITAIGQLQKLEHLSLQVTHDIAQPSLLTLITSLGPRLKTLSLEKFLDADDEVLEAIKGSCTNLTKLRVSENDTATDAGFTNLFTDWANPPLEFVDFNSTRDVDNNNPTGPDEAVGLASSAFKALMAHSGSNLKHLDISSCRHISLGAFMDVFEGDTKYPALEHINISFCNTADTSVVAGIFKSCPNLKQVIAFGCFNVMDVVVPRNIALIGVPRAQDAIEQFGVGIGVDEAVGRMVEVGA